MQYSSNRLIIRSLPIRLFLASCDAKPECDSPETRKAVLDSVSDDHRNPLVEFAAHNSTVKASLDNNRPLISSRREDRDDLCQQPEANPAMQRRDFGHGGGC